MNAPGNQPWWAIPENFHTPMVFYMEKEQEDFIFGHGDAYLRCIEMHSQTFIQLESWFTALGYTRVTVVGPLRARQWLFDMICNIGSEDLNQQNRGLEMLQLVRRQPLTQADFSTAVWRDNGDLSLAAYMNGTITLEECLSLLFDCLGFH